MSPRVVVSQYLYPEVIEELQAAGLEVETRDADHPLPVEDLAAAVGDADGLVCHITDRVSAEVFESASQLRVVANVAVGYDNIDVAAATRHGVMVCNTPGVLTDATADLTMALMLATARRVPEADAKIRRGGFDRWKFDDPLMGSDISGQRIGIIGLGEIGQAVARRCRDGFGMQVSYHNSRRLPSAQESSLGVTYQSLPDLLSTSDIVSIHAPLTESTRHLIDADALALMQPSALLINTARGPIVDEGALATALAGGALAGAGLDVFEREPAVHPALLELHPRVVLMPHLGSATRSTRVRMAQMAARNVIAALSGNAPDAVVNPEADRHSPGADTTGASDSPPENDARGTGRGTGA